MTSSLDSAIEILANSQRLLVFTGAGISTESGIPDFRGPEGVWTKVDPADFTIQRFMASSDHRERDWERRFSSGVTDAAPNAAHFAVADLVQNGPAIGVVTQNIDGLHHAAGLDPTEVVELHGSSRVAECVECAIVESIDEVRARWQAGERDLRCPSCQGIVKPGVVLFGEALPAAEVARANSMAAVADAVLVIGSTLSVYPAAFVPLDVVSAGNPMIIVNLGPTDHDQLATTVVEASAGEAVPAIAAALSS
ncbi:MAG: NAD-dependent protein deacylase [Acidimicrobiia bacterium]|nr:NAD-dependent protein deacylase [Acidimicrobiia bacterium]